MKLQCSPGQHFAGVGCLLIMARKKDFPKQEVPSETLSASVYESNTPIWHRYYMAVRKRIKFPRYYKRVMDA